MGKAIGIDFGTTYSCMAVIQDGKPVVIPNAEGDYLTPSVVTIDETQNYMVGISAKRRAIHNPKDTTCSFKRLIGHGFNEQIAEDMKWQTHTLTIGTTNDYRIMLQGKEHSLQNISSLLLKKLKVDAEAWLGEEVNEVVITVPARFDHNQRQLVHEAAKSAGLTVLRIINEPTAACLAYGLKSQRDKTIAVYHLGGGTFDTSIVSVGEGTFLVYATTGNNYLGGDDFDRRIVQWLCDGLKHKHKVDITTDKVALQRLRDAAERAKCELSSAHEAIIELPYIINTEDGFIDYDVTLTREGLEKLVSDLIDETIFSCKQVLDYSREHISRRQWNEKLIIDEVLLVGGQTRMPLVIKKVGEFFQKEPRRGVHPDEAVAIGAAIQAGVLKGEVKGVLLLDVTPLTLGIEIQGGKFSTLIPRNTTIPTSRSELFTTTSDNQSSVEIHILQGESDRLIDNVSLGHFMLHGILPAPKGVPQIEVTFDIDANGILSVKAHDKGTGREQRVTIAGSL